MFRLLVWASIAGSLLLVAAFVPVGGRTVAERWKSAPSSFAFVEEGGKELAGGVRHLLGEKPEPRRAAQRASSQPKSLARSGPKPGAAQEAPAPREHHTAADRDALDRIVAEHASR